MTIDEYAQACGILLKSAYAHLDKHNIYLKHLPKINGKWQVDGDKIQQVYEQRGFKYAKKGKDEMDMYDIKDKYGHIISHNKLNNAVKFDKNWPTPYRVTRNVGKNCRLWRKADIEHYFKNHFVEYKKRADKGKNKPGKRIIITGHMADTVWFCTGRYWRYGQAIKTNLTYYTEI